MFSNKFQQESLPILDKGYKMKYKLLTETEFERIDYKSELCEQTNSKKMYIEGITLQGNVKNRNNRIYPSNILGEALNNYVNETKRIGMTMEGCLDHPEKNAHSINMKEISHRFVAIERDGDNWRTKALILDTPNGKIVKNLIEGGTKLGISSRMLGQVKSDSNGIDIVQEGLRVVTPGDIVYRPSAPNALIDAIYENKEYVYENGNLIEKDLSEDLDAYKKMIKETTKKDRSIVFEKIILDYFKKINIQL